MTLSSKVKQSKKSWDCDARFSEEKETFIVLTGAVFM